jgi:hypothetical protein
MTTLKLRRTLNLLTVLSLLLCMAAATLCVRSFWVIDCVEWVTHLSEQEVRWLFAESEAGALRVGRKAVNLFPQDSYARERMKKTPTWERRRAGGAAWRKNLKPQARGDRYTLGMRTIETAQVRLPYWILLTVAAIAPSFWVWRRRRRHKPGQCAACGYDLCATPVRCPECGHTAAEPAAQAST